MYRRRCLAVSGGVEQRCQCGAECVALQAAGESQLKLNLAPNITPMASSMAATYPPTPRKKKPTPWEYVRSSAVQFVIVNGATAGMVSGYRRYKQKQKTLDVYRKSPVFNINSILRSKKTTVVLTGALLLAMSLPRRPVEVAEPSNAGREEPQDLAQVCQNVPLLRWTAF